MTDGRAASSRFREQLREEVQSLWVLDAHEHLYLPAARAEQATDCFYLTSHYLRDDPPRLARRLLADNGIALFNLSDAHVTAATSRPRGLSSR